MMAPDFTETLPGMLVRLTIVLAIGWLVVRLLRNGNPRWTMLTTRLMTVAAVALPAVYLVGPSMPLAILPTSSRVQQRAAMASIEDADETAAFAHSRIAVANPTNDESLSSHVTDTQPTKVSEAISAIAVEPQSSPVRIAESDNAITPMEHADGLAGQLLTDAMVRKKDSGNSQFADQTTLKGNVTPSQSAMARAVPWLLTVWMAGASLLVLRLLLQVRRTRTLLKSTSLGNERINAAAKLTSRRLLIRRCPNVLVSNAIAGPCTAGWFNPKVLLPCDWAEDLSDSELQTVLSHEFMHVTGRDPAWDLIVRMVASVWWFHPLLWRLPSTHRLACEHACDVAAANTLGTFSEYRRQLANWALRAHGQSVSTMTALSMADQSLLNRRLKWLERPRTASRLRVTSLSTVSVIALAVMFVGGTVRVVNQPLVADEPATIPVTDEPKRAVAKPAQPLGRTKDVADIDLKNTSPKTVTVVDKNDKPVDGAEVRVGWWEDDEGDMLGQIVLVAPTTDAEGKVTIDVPRGATRALLSVDAEGYARFGKQISLAGSPVLRLTPGKLVTVRVVDVDGEAVPSANPMLENSRVWGSEFQSPEPGVFFAPNVKPDRRWIRVVAPGVDDPAAFRFSSLLDVDDETLLDKNGMITAVVKPGIRLEGRLDKSVPRPISQGYVELYISETERNRIPDLTGWTWQDFAKIQPDGTFVFESLPQNGHVQLFALADGYQSKKPTEDELRAYLKKHNAGSEEVVKRALSRPNIWPQLFPLTPNSGEQTTVNVTVPCRPTGSIDVRVLDPAGNPIEGAEVSFNPNGYFLGAELFIPGTESSSASWVVKGCRDELTRERRPWVDRTFLSVKSGRDGVAHIVNLPGSGRESYDVKANGFVMPIHPTSGRDREWRSAVVEVQPGKTIRRTITMERDVPRHERELMIVDHVGKPVANISATVVEMSFEDDPDDWQLWAVQRFGPVVSEQTSKDGRLLLKVPTSVEGTKVHSLRVKLGGTIPMGRVGRETNDDIDGSVNDTVAVPAREDERVISLRVSDKAPLKVGYFRDVLVAYINPSRLVLGEPKDVLRQLAEKPSLLLLRNLLAKAKFDAADPIAFESDRNWLSPYNNRTPVAEIQVGERKIVVAMCAVRPKDATWKDKPEGRFPPKAAFVFDSADGRLLRMIGGGATSKGSYEHATLQNLGGTDDYFVSVSGFEDHPPFEYITKWYRVGSPGKPALTVWHYANSNGRTTGKGPGSPVAEYATLSYEFNGEDLDHYAPGSTPNGQLVPRTIYWDGTRNKFIGAATQSFGERPLYQVVMDQSAEFLPLQSKPGEVVVGGGRRDYEYWHAWNVTVPQYKKSTSPARLKLLLIMKSDAANDEAKPKILFETELARGELHNLQLQIVPEKQTETESTVRLLVNKQPMKEATGLQVPLMEINDRATVANQAVCVSKTTPVDLFHKPLKAGGFLVWRIETD